MGGFSSPFEFSQTVTIVGRADIIGFYDVVCSRYIVETSSRYFVGRPGQGLKSRQVHEETLTNHNPENKR